MRTFIGVPIEPSRELKKILRRLDLMGRAIKPARPDQMHITLKFLGEIEEGAVVDLSRAMEAACSPFGATSIELKGVGVFPHRRRPTVLWAGISDPMPLVKMEAELSARLVELGYPREQRAYHPHLTLARVKARPPREFNELLDEHAADSPASGFVWGTSPINEVVLYHSQLSEAGSTYVPLATVGL